MRFDLDTPMVVNAAVSRLWRYRTWVPRSIRQKAKPFLGRLARRQGLAMPLASIVRVGDTVTLFEYAPSHTDKGAYDQILPWVNQTDARAKRVANLIAASEHLPTRRIKSIVEENPNDIYISNMYEFIHRGAATFEKAKTGDFRNLILAINPSSPLPILVRMIWPKTKVLCIFTADTGVDAEQLQRADGIIADSSTLQRLSSDTRHPLLLLANNESDVLAHIKAFIQSTAPARENYLFSMNGIHYREADFLNRKDIDIVFIGADDTISSASNFSTFETFLERMIFESDDVLFNSKWLYPMESMVSQGEWVRLAERILAQGGRPMVARNAT